MPTLKSGFLFIGHWDKKLEDYGAQIAPDLQTGRQWIEKYDYDVL